jgi:aminoglycoside phosphotransferase (APT) family kinase protein
MIYESIISKIPLDKGWSLDKKYRAITASGESYLLRIGPQERIDRLQQQHQRMQEVAKLAIPMCLSLEEGICPDGPYLIQSWIDGLDAEEILPGYSEEQQYAYGLEAGRILKKIHSIPAPADVKPWSEYFSRKIDRKLDAYAKCALKYENGELLVQYVQDHRHLLADRPQTFQHGDFHCGNLMIDQQGVLTVIDFDKWDYGDPWEEFNRIVWCAQCAPAFATGRVDGYFDENVPEEFWQLLALYVSNNCIGSLPWAIPYGEREINVMRRQAAEILRWYDHFRTVIPSWYRK